MANSLLLEPNRIYDVGAIVLALDVPSSSIDRARRAGSLRSARVGRRVLFRGQWLLDWLERNAGESRVEATPDAS